LFPVLTALVLAGCVLEVHDNRITLSGKVAVNLNDVPFNVNDYAVPGGFDETWRTGLRLYLGGSDKGASILHPMNFGVALEPVSAGIYTWSRTSIPQANPTPIYFVVVVQSPDLQGPGDYAWYSQVLKIEGSETFTKNKADIDLGTIDFYSLRLSGNLPVTVNGGPVQARMLIGGMETPVGVEEVAFTVDRNGSWSAVIQAQAEEQALRFRLFLEAELPQGDNRYFYRYADLGTELVYRQDKVVAFPQYPRFDFKTITLSGTMRLITPSSMLPRRAELTFSAYGPDDESVMKSYTGIQFSSFSGDNIGRWTVIFPDFEWSPENISLELVIFQSGTPGEEGESIYTRNHPFVLNPGMDTSNVDLGVFDFSD
jgi:hypothetical protein